MLILGTRFLILCHFIWSNFEICVSHNKMSSPQSHQWGNLSQVYKCMFFSYPPVHKTICWSKCQFSFLLISQEIHKWHFLHRYSECRNISNNTSITKSFRYLNPRNFLQWMTCFLDVSKHVLRQTWKTSLTKNKGIIWSYLRMIW